MNKLPTDVLREILDQLDPEYTDVTARMKFWAPRKNVSSQNVISDIRQFRLVCKRFAELGAQYLFRTIAHRYNSKSFDRLSSLADHPVFASHVKKFIYLMPYFYVAGAKDFTQFQHDFKKDDEIQVGSYSTIFQEPLHCLQVFQEQQGLMSSGNDLKILKKAMKSFSSLQQVQILSVLGEKDQKLYDLAQDYEDWDYVDVKWIPACQHAIDTMLQALDYGRPPVASFVSPLMNPQSLISLRPEVQKVGRSTWSQLTYLKLNFNHQSDRDWYQIRLEHKITMLSDFFKDLFNTAANLTELHIGFFPSSPLRLTLEEVFHDAVWPRLRVFGIESWRLTSEEIIRKIDKHCHTLRGVRLASIYLKEGSLWHDVVKELKKLNLEWLSLDNIGYEEEFDSRRPIIPIFPGFDDEDDDDADDEESHMTGHTGLSGGSLGSSLGMGFQMSMDGNHSSSNLINGSGSGAGGAGVGPSSSNTLMNGHNLHNGHTNGEESSSSLSRHSRTSSTDATGSQGPDALGDIGSPTTSHSLNSVGGVVPNGGPNGHLHLNGRVTGGGGGAVPPTKDPYDELENMDLNLEDDGQTVRPLQMIHWERWVVGRDVYTGKKYFREL